VLRKISEHERKREQEAGGEYTEKGVVIYTPAKYYLSN
jgi:hypothetical protein